MPGYMEREKKTLALFILLPLLLVCRSDECPRLPDNLTCYNDYSQNITCLWNSTYVTNHTESTCTIHAKYQSPYVSYSASCHLEPVDISRPALKMCSLIFKRVFTFSSFHVLSLNLSCNHVEPIITSYNPSCHIRVNPPGRPEVNFTTVSWLSELSRHAMMDLYDSELQWKQQDQSWSDPAVQKKLGIQCERECTAQLKPDLLLRDETYEARVRVRSIFENREGAWSDWGPTASWVSPVGKLKPPSDLTCYNDYSQNITCLWNSTYVTNHTESACTIHAKYQSPYVSYSASCHLEPVDLSRPALKMCSLIFKRVFTFSSFHVLSLNLSCNHVEPIITSYNPSCHIRVNPPGRPEVNFTTVSWLSELSRHAMMDLYDSELQWKQQDQSWSDPAVQKKLGIQCERECTAQLKPDLLLRDETYEARVRVRSIFENREGAWSDWGPTASWVSPVGKLKPPSDAPKLPSVSVSPSAEIVEGSSVTLTCSSDANPAANYTWYKEDDHKPLSKNSQLVFSSIQSSDSGEYYCTAVNKLGMKTSRNKLINVKYAPKLPSVSVSPSAEIVEGSSVTLTCSSDANPAANYTWYKEDEDSPKASGQNFTITNIRPEHSGNYSCEARNSQGYRNSTLQLVVGTMKLEMIMIIIRLTLVILMLIPLLLLSIWTRKKKPGNSEAGADETVDVMR